MKNNLKLKILGTILITLGLSLLVGFTRPKTDYSKLLFDWFWVNKTHYSTNNNIIFVGDSRIYRGISTEAVKTIFPNQRVLNLGYSSGGLNNEIFDFATNLLNPKSKIKIIVLGISPFSLTEEARKNEHFLQELNRPSAEIIERKYINPYIYLFEPIKITDYQPISNKIIYPQIFHSGGWVESFKLPENKSEALTSYRNTLSKTKLSKISIDETLEFVSKMKNKGVEIYGFRPPSCEEMEKLENEISDFNENEFQTLFEKNGGIWIDIPNRYSFNSYDGSHLHYESAKKLSIILAKKINAK